MTHRQSTVGDKSHNLGVLYNDKDEIIWRIVKHSYFYELQVWQLLSSKSW